MAIQSASTTNVRLVGFNAPETRRAACEAESELGAKATRRLRDIVRAGNLDFEYVACSCRAGTQGTQACNYGRDCGTLKSQGRDVGAILMEEGLAVSFVCGATRCPKPSQIARQFGISQSDVRKVLASDTGTRRAT
jgi:endonuclease YncB( thermonuclease family)